ncbi:MAG: hypothetical protein QOK33_2447 [Mycobacterium sp.]|nr:hypothetical protein [Mycobacterium sp.]
MGRFDHLVVTAGGDYRRIMAYDEELANRIRALVSGERGVEEKRMFGGLAFLIDGHMAVAASGRGGLMVRVSPDDTPRLLQREHVEPMVRAGREARGWVRVATEGVANKRQLQSWVTRGVGYAKGLPPSRKLLRRMPSGTRTFDNKEK